MKKVLFLLSLMTILSGCRVETKGTYNEKVIVELLEYHTAQIGFYHKKGILRVEMYVHKNGQRISCSSYRGEIDYVTKTTNYTIPLKQDRVAFELPQKEQAFYEDKSPIQLEVTHMSAKKGYEIRISQSNCPLLNMKEPKLVNSTDIISIVQEAEENPTFWNKTKLFLAKGAVVLRDVINSPFDHIFGNIEWVNHWWFLLYLGGLLLIAIGLKVFYPLVWVGVIMQYAYLQFMTPPFFMLWPSIVGWGWTIVCVLPMIFLVSFNITQCISVIGSVFNGLGAFIILFIPALISLMSLGELLFIIIEDHFEIIVFFILASVGELYIFLGTFTDGYGNVWGVYGPR